MSKFAIRDAYFCGKCTEIGPVIRKTAAPSKGLCRYQLLRERCAPRLLFIYMYDAIRCFEASAPTSADQPPRAP